MTANRTLKRIWRHRTLFLMLLIPLAFIIIFAYVPIGGTVIAFKNYSYKLGVWGSPWTGLDNFVRFFNYPRFGQLIRNTLLVSFYSLVAGFPMPIILALSLNCVRRERFKKTVQMFTYLPYFISVVVLCGMLFMFFNPRLGFLGQIISGMKGQMTDVFLSPTAFLHIMVWSGVWQGMGFSSILYISILSSVSPELHEAAVIDGATRMQRIIHIDFPSLIPTAVIMLIMSAGNILSTGFEKILLLQNNANLTMSEVIDTYVYKAGLTATIPDQGYATAVGLFKSIIGFLLLIVVNRIAQKTSENSLW
ncbi:MAG: ABC transporter permease [Oscillospiraceae bacterium]